MLARPDVFTDDVIIDELLGFFGAATETTHNVMKTTLTYLTKTPDSLAKVRAEFQQILSVEAKSYPDFSKLSLADQFKKVVTVDNCFDLEFLNMVILESLRFHGPAGISPVVFS